jgi:SulP family sulfate permease
MPDGSATAHIYRPKIVTVLAAGYNLNCFRRDMLAALTVAIVALPLSMAIAVASGVSPERGLYAAVISGFLVSALGGSRYQIGGPAGAFIVLVAATATKFGLEGLLLTVFLSGFMLTLIGLLRLGSLIRYIPRAACRDRRLHLRDCCHDLCKPAQGSRRPEIARCGTWTAVAQAGDARSGVADT